MALSIENSNVSNVFQLVNTKKDLAQVILHPKQGLFTFDKYISFMSSNLEMSHPKTSILSKFKSGIPVILGDRYVENISDNIGYLGICNGMGRTIIINPAVISNMYINGQYIIGYTKNIKLYSVPFRDLASLEYSSMMKATADVRNDGFPPLEYVFVQAQPNIIEKVLGNDETISITRGSLVCMKDTARIMPINSVNDTLETIRGPGLIMFGTGNIVRSRALKPSFIILPIISVALGMIIGFIVTMRIILANHHN